MSSYLKSNLAKNIVTMYSVQVIRLFLPLLMLPLLSSRLSINSFGIYLYAISISIWITLLIEYGFNISSTRQISTVNHPNHIIEIVKKTQSAKYILTCLFFILIPIIYLTIPILSGELSWAITIFIVGCLTALTPQYYYQGIENLTKFGLVELISGSFLMFSVYFFVKGNASDDFLKLSLVLSRMIPFAFLSLDMYKKLKIELFTFSLHGAIKQLKEGWSISFFQIIISFYTVFNLIFLGFFVSIAQVAIYGVSEKLIRAGLGFIGQLSNVVFPRINNIKSEGHFNLKKVRLITLILFSVVGFIGYVFVNLLSTYVIKFLFDGKYLEAVAVINVMALVIPAIAISNVLSLQYLLVDGLEKVLNKVVLLASLVNLFLAYCMITTFGYIGMAYTWVILEWGIAITLGLIIYFKKTTQEDR